MVCGGVCACVCVWCAVVCGCVCAGAWRLLYACHHPAGRRDIVLSPHVLLGPSPALYVGGAYGARWGEGKRGNVPMLVGLSIKSQPLFNLPESLQRLPPKGPEGPLEPFQG